MAFLPADNYTELEGESAGAKATRKDAQLLVQLIQGNQLNALIKISRTFHAFGILVACLLVSSCQSEKDISANKKHCADTDVFNQLCMEYHMEVNGLSSGLEYAKAYPDNVKALLLTGQIYGWPFTENFDLAKTWALFSDLFKSCTLVTASAAIGESENTYCRLILREYYLASMLHSHREFLPYSEKNYNDLVINNTLWKLNWRYIDLYLAHLIDRTRFEDYISTLSEGFRSQIRIIISEAHEPSVELARILFAAFEIAHTQYDDLCGSRNSLDRLPSLFCYGHEIARDNPDWFIYFREDMQKAFTGPLSATITVFAGDIYQEYQENPLAINQRIYDLTAINDEDLLCADLDSSTSCTKKVYIGLICGSYTLFLKTSKLKRFYHDACKQDMYHRFG